MKNEELMMPRYKIMKPYPLSHMYFKVGDILTWKGDYYEGPIGVRMHKDTVERYPHLFKRLEWWEFRRKKDVPLSIKYRNKTYEVVKWAKVGDRCLLRGKRSEFVVSTKSITLVTK